MRILVIGGTIFLGRYIVKEAIERGHDVTLFNRGKHNPHLFPDIEKIKGDRTQDLKKLANKTWDVVIDTCGYVPRIVHESAKYLHNYVNNYVFISTVSVYNDQKEERITEDYPVGKLENEKTEDVDGTTYGPLKALCEKQVIDMFNSHSLIIRPGLIVGPHDPTNRFTYWPVRIARGGNVIAPGNPENPIQIIDVRDLAKWIITMVEFKRTGIYNATGPNYTLTWQKFLQIAKDAINPNTEYSWVNDKFLLENELEPWTELPLWIPYSDEMKGFNAIHIGKAIDAELKFRPLVQTLKDTLDWFKQGEFDAEEIFNTTLKKEAEILKKWKKKD